MPPFRSAWPPASGGLWRLVSRHLKTPLVLFLILFVWMQLMTVGSRQPLTSSLPAESVNGPSKDRSQQSYMEFLQQVTNISVSINSTFGGSGAGSGRESPNASEILWQIQRLNNEQKIWNEDQFGPVISDTVIFVIQVHTRQQYLETLIESLRSTKGIEATLLVFSHDVYDVAINAAVQAIDFAKVRVWQLSLIVVSCPAEPLRPKVVAGPLSFQLVTELFRLEHALK